MFVLNESFSIGYVDYVTICNDRVIKSNNKYNRNLGVICSGIFLL